MSQSTEIIRRGGVSPLVLRLAVAGVLAYCGARNFRGDDQLVTRPDGEGRIAALPDTAAKTITVELPAADSVIADRAVTDDAIPDGAITDVAESLGSIEGTKVSFPPNKLLGIAEMFLGFGFATGLLVRLLSALGLGSIVAGAMGASGSLSGYWGVDILADVYASSPAAALLLGAICLALMLSGGGRVGLDHMLLSRRRREPEDALTA